MIENTCWEGWKTIRALGEGRCGVVYEVQKQDVNGYTQKYALKVLSVPNSCMETQGWMSYQDAGTLIQTMKSRMMSEISAINQLNSNIHIVPYLDYKIIDHINDGGFDILLLMELLTPLDAYASVYPLDESEIIKLGIAMSEALTECHSRGILHCDIKLSNIFVDQNHNYKLGDFGLSGIKMDESLGTSFGMLNYMAPEMMQGICNEQTDLYSLGIVLYYFLNGMRFPFEPAGPSTNEARKIARNQRLSGLPVPPPKNGSEALQEVVLTLLSSASADRYQSAAALKRSLQLICDKMNSNYSGNYNPEMGVTRPVTLQNADKFSDTMGENSDTQCKISDISEKTSDTSVKKFPVKLVAGLCIAAVCMIGGIAYFAGSASSDKSGGDGADISADIGENTEKISGESAESTTEDTAESTIEDSDSIELTTEDTAEGELPKILQSSKVVHREGDNGKTHYYKLYNANGKGYTWEDAEEKCEELGGHLVVITSESEMNFLKNYLLDPDEGILKESTYHVWLGAKDKDHFNQENKSNIPWITGETSNYENFENEQPNGKGDDTQYYLEMQLTHSTNGGIDDDGDEYCTWTDINNDGYSNERERYASSPDYNSTPYYGFICEWDKAEDAID